MTRSARLKALENLFKNAEQHWICDNCGSEEVGNKCTNCGTPKDKNDPLYAITKVWGDLEELSHYLKYEMNEEKWKQSADHCMGVVHDIRKLLFFNSNAPFKNTKW